MSDRIDPRYKIDRGNLLKKRLTNKIMLTPWHRKHANSQTESKSSQSSTSSAATTASSATTTNEIPPRNLIQLDPLQLNVTLAPVLSRPQSAGPAGGGSSRQCKHCSVSQHNFLAPERIDKASNTEKSSSHNKHSWRGKKCVQYSGDLTSVKLNTSQNLVWQNCCLQVLNSTT